MIGFIGVFDRFQIELYTPDIGPQSPLFKPDFYVKQGNNPDIWSQLVSLDYCFRQAIDHNLDRQQPRRTSLINES